MEFTLKSLSKAAIPRSIEKAERYRLINQPWAAESICLDILRSEPGNQRAVHVLLLAITDQFAQHPDTGELDARAKSLLDRLTDGAVVVVPGDRTEVLLAVLTAHDAATFPSISGVIESATRVAVSASPRR